jgi:hypothetical protein
LLEIFYRPTRVYTTRDVYFGIALRFLFFYTLRNLLKR